MEEDKEKLEKELEFLKESLDSEVISEEEYISGKERIENQLIKINTDEIKEKRDQEEIRTEGNPKEDNIIESDTKIEENKNVEGVVKESEKEEIESEEEKIKSKETEKEESQETTIPISDIKKEELKSEDDFLAQEEQRPVVNVKKKSNWKFLVMGLLTIVIIAIFAVPFFNAEKPNEQVNEDEYIDDLVVEFIACSSDEECRKEGKKGRCVNSGTENAECEFQDVIITELTIVNTRDCFNCDISRVLSLLKGFFPGLNVKNLDYESEQGEQLINKLQVGVLPAYIFDTNLENTVNFENIKVAFTEVNDGYIMNKEASGANYFIDREFIPNRFDVFLVENDPSTLKAEQNLKEFLELFGDNIEFFKHNKKDVLTTELEIKTFPTFLINNKIKFSGVQSADKIRENFCQLNELDECNEELLKSLI